MADRILVVGMGAAGLAVCEELRARGWMGELTVLSAEPRPPYDRPPLSKQFLQGTAGRAEVQLVGGGGLDDLGARILLGRTAVHLDARARQVVDDTGSVYAYDELVVATGVRPRAVAGPDGPVPTLRTVEDAERLRDALAVGGSLLVVGGGFLGLEVAASACASGLAVTVIEPLERPLAGRLGDAMAERLLVLHHDHGVRVHTGSTVASLARGVRGQVTATLDDGTLLQADALLAAVGASPDLRWLETGDVHVDDGVVCDRWCRAVPGVWAAGDVARWYHAGLARYVRLEHRVNATEQGRAVAGNILGDERPFSPLPYFWTDQHGVRIQFAGTADGASPVVALRDATGAPSVVDWYRDGVLCGVVAWDSPRPFLERRRRLLATVTAPDCVPGVQVLCPACGGLIEAVGHDALVRAAWRHTVEVHDYVIPPEHVLQRAEVVD